MQQYIITYNIPQQHATHNTAKHISTYENTIIHNKAHKYTTVYNSIQHKMTKHDNS